MRRRSFIEAGFGLFGIPAVGNAFYDNVYGAETTPSVEGVRLGKAKSVIQIWMWGGPSQLETFDPKPGAGKDYCGPWTLPIKTNVPGIEISQSLPELAKCADLYAIIRSMTHGTNHHETAAYMMQTGRMPGGGLVYPNIGAIISKIDGYDKGYKAPIPPYVVLTTSQGRFSESGFLGPRYKPFVTGGDPNKTPFLVSGFVAEGMTDKRQQLRRDMSGKIDALGAAMPENPLFEKIDHLRDSSYRLLESDDVKVFNLETEPDKIRDAYGRNWFGQSCLMARRLVERNVPYVTLNYRGWDTHKKHFEILTRRQPELDQGLSMLLKDLRDRGLLDQTVVWWSGEFGRTPKIGWEAPWLGGRGHYGRCFSAVVAGGGFKGGKVVGASSDTGETVLRRPVAPQDLLGSIIAQAGIDPNGKLENNKGFDLPVMTPASEAGLLLEIMG
ncbi:MAG: DUF1501 domain-containing protein [Thermoguttaceae bacterium]|nr:DUF1501 domain-containing protein [Thermoguttaceae bacterium]